MVGAVGTRMTAFGDLYLHADKTKGLKCLICKNPAVLVKELLTFEDF